jgi:RHS repeat-associated protein
MWKVSVMQVKRLGRTWKFTLALILVLGSCGRAMASASATLTVGGSEQKISGSWDSGNITVVFNGFSESVHYAQFSTPASLASALAGMFSRDYIGEGLCANASGAIITFQLTNGGSFGGIQITGPTTSFTLSESGWSSQVTDADTGTVTLTVNGSTVAQTQYGEGSTPVAGLAAHVTSGAPVTVTAVNDAISIQSTTTGASTDDSYSLSGATSDPTQFSQASFMSQAATGNLDGGANQDTNNGVTVYSYSGVTCQGNGNVTGYMDSVMGTWSHIAYDSLNRISGAQVTPTSSGIPYSNYCWSYDAFGNRTMQEGSNEAFQSGSGGLSVCNPQAGATVATDWATYATTGSVNNQVGTTNAPGATTTYQYDQAGNVTFDGTNKYLYDADGRICAVQNQVSFNGGPGPITGYVYDADGGRVSKGTISIWSCDPSVNGLSPAVSETDYILGPGDEQLTELASDPSGIMVWTHTNVWVDGQLLGTYDTNGLHFYLNDWLGTRRAQTDYTGVLEQTCTSLPFGDSLNCTGSGQYSASLQYPTENHFTGKERDTESGNDYFGARYYASSMGRFLSPDDGSDQNALDPASWNLYSYVRNNPLTGTDDDGHTVTICSNDANGSQHCTSMDDDVYQAAQQSKNSGGLNGPSLGSLESSSSGSGSITDSNGNTVGSVQWTPDNPGIQGPQAIQAFGQIGNQGMGAIKWFGEQMAWNVAGGFAAHGIGLGVEALQASRAAALARAAEAAADAEKITNGHAFLKHAGEFGNITKNEFKDLVQETISNPSDARSLANGRTAYWNESEQMVVIKNPNAADGGTAFRPTAGKSYFDNLR